MVTVDFRLRGTVKTMTTEEDNSFTDKVEEVPTANYEEDQSEGEENTEAAERFVAWTVAGFSGILALFFLQSNIFISIFLVSVGLLFLLLYYSDESLQEVLEEMEQQQSSSKSDQKKICQNCGWQNPKDNNYCHDCGGELNP